MSQSKHLVELLKKYDDAYHNGEALVSDAEYDAIRKELKYMDPTNEYLLEVGAPVYGVKYKLPYPMGSLDQKYNDNDLSNWIEKYKVEDVIVTDKLDGYSCLLVYKQTKMLNNAYSRGDGIEGSDIMQHVGNMPAVPSKLHGKHDIETTVAIRGEIIISPIIFYNKYASQYKNPRNFVSGIMNRKEASLEILNDISFIAYEIVSDTELSKEDSLEILKDWGFDTPNYIKMNSRELNYNVLNDLVTECKRNSEYELDGVVLTVNNLKQLESLSNSQSLNPEHSIKFKLAGVNTVEAVVDFIQWNESKNGLLKPRIFLKPVDIGGVTVTHATGHNARFIKDKQIGKGSVVLLERGGDVIPSILKNLKPTQADLPTDVEWEWTTNDKDEQVEIRLLNQNDPKVIFKQVLDFFVSLDVEQLKKASLTSIFDAVELWGLEYTDILGYIFDLTTNEFVQILGVNGEKIYNSLHRRLENLSMPILAGSLNYFGVGFGISRANQLFGQVSFDVLSKMSAEEITELHGFDIKTATNIFNGISLLENFLVKYSDNLKFKQEEVKTNQLGNMIIVMTGFRDAELQKKIESMGGKVGSSVTGKTTHVIADGKSITDGSGKVKAATEKGIPVMRPDQFKDMFNV